MPHSTKDAYDASPPPEPRFRIVEDARERYDAEPRRALGFGIVDPQVRALKNGYATAVYEALAAHADADGACWPSLATICEHVGWSKPTVIKAVKVLADAGLVTVEQRRHHGYVIGNRYTLPLRCRTKSTTLNQDDSIIAEAVNDVESSGKGDLPRQSTTFTQAVNDVESSGKPRLHKQDSRKQDSREQEDDVTADAVTPPQAVEPKPKKSAKTPKPKRTQTEAERLAFVMVDAFAHGCNRLPKDIAGKERYDARKAFEPLTDRYAPDDVQACTEYMRSDPFWRRGNLSAVTVARQLPDWIEQGRPESMNNVRPIRKTASEVNAEFDREWEREMGRSATGTDGEQIIEAKGYAR